MARVEEVASGVHRVEDGLVNWYVVRDGDELMLVDAGWPRSFGEVEQVLAELGYEPRDVRHVLLTHGHPDHLGAAEKIRGTTGATVHAFAGEADRVKGKSGASPFRLVPGLLPTLYKPSATGFVLRATARGFLFPSWPKQVTTFRADGPLDLPGRPQALETPGHTQGHVSFLFADKGVLITGDAMATLDPLSRDTGPRLLPSNLNADTDQARVSLDTLAAQAADVVLPGHGDPFRGTPADAVERAKSAG